MRYRAALIATPIVILLVAVASLSAAPLRQIISPAPDTVPQTITYQGVLTDANGSAVNDGRYDATFRIYPNSTGGASLWVEQHTIDVEGGLFSVALGSERDISSALGQGPDIYLGITVGSGSELRPRQPITSVPFAVRAKDAETLNGADAQEIVDAAIAGSQVNDADLACVIDRRLVNSLDTYVPSELCIPSPQPIFTDVAKEVTPSIAIRSDGTPVIASVIYSGAMYMTDCKDKLCGGFTSRPKVASKADVEGAISLAIDSQDRASVTYYSAESDTLNLLVCMDVACEQSQAVQLFDEGSRNGIGNALVLDVNGLPRIIYNQTQSGTNFRILVCEDRLCENSTVRSLGGGTFFQAEHVMDGYLRDDGTPIFSYFWESQKRIQLAICTSADCSGDIFGASLTSIDVDFENVSGSTVSALQNSFGVSAFTHEDELRYFVCGGEFCSPRTQADPTGNGFILKSIARPEQSNGLGPALFGVSMVILPDETPLFAYIDRHVGLMVAKCDTSDCANAPTPVRLGKNASVGTDMALGDDGAPVIAYVQIDPQVNAPRPYIVRCEQCLDW